MNIKVYLGVIVLFQAIIFWRIGSVSRKIQRKEDTILGAIDDLKTAVAGEVTALGTLTGDVDAAVLKITAAGASDADIEAAAQAIATANQSINDSATKLANAIGVTPPPAPTQGS